MEIKSGLMRDIVVAVWRVVKKEQKADKMVEQKVLSKDSTLETGRVSMDKL
jgi:hypothetical protein